MQSTRVSPFSHASLPFIGLWALFFTMPVFAGASGTSIQVTFTPDADTTLYQGVDNSNGGGNHIFAGNSAGLGFRRSLLRFDLSDIPRNATIEDVTLQMRMTRTISGTLNVRLHRALNDWGEGNVHAPGQEGGGGAAQTGDATWDHRFFPDVLWDTPGGDFAGTQSAARAVMGVDDYTWTGAGMVADVQQWVSQPSSNFGWLIKGSENGTLATAKRFDSRQSDDPATVPVLTIEMTVPPVEPIPATSMVSLVFMMLGVLMVGIGFHYRRIRR